MNELKLKCEQLKPSEELVLNLEELKNLFDPYDLGDMVLQYNLQEFFKQQGCLIMINGHYVKVQK